MIPTRACAASCAATTIAALIFPADADELR
jgi:hypothetical protein